MPSSQVTPIVEVDKYGLIFDRPAPSLPSNAFSDGKNIRFRDGTIRKMQGELNIFPNLFDDPNTQVGGVDVNYDGSFVKYVVFWPNPNIIGSNIGYYLVIAEETRLVADDSVPPPGNVDPTQQRDIAYLVSVDGTSKVQKGVFEAVAEGLWNHTFFQGGFALIINNGIDKPNYILDDEGNTDINAVPNFLDLPGWDSYNVSQISLEDTFDPNNDSYIFDLGKAINFNLEYIVVERRNSTAPNTVITLNPSGAGANELGYIPPDYSTISTTPFGTSDYYEIYYDSSTGTCVLNLPSNLSSSGTDTVTIKIVSRDPVSVRSRVVRSFGDFLVAGDLIERSEVAPYPVIRALPGVVRTSDVAAPGAIPNNWNPFASGVSTAEEYIVSETAPVTEMAEMQGNLYIYTTNSISVMRKTGNPASPIAISSITDSYGCQDTNSMLEFEGKHFVVGSKDVYLFAGNPSGIESIADGRVRRYLFQNMNPTGVRRVFVLDNKQREEIWICYPTIASATGDCDEALIWSYSNNTWTRRELRGAISGTVAPIPGGGLPSVDIDLAGTSGDNGVTNIGSFELRMMGTDPTLALTTDSENVYTGVSTTAVYVDGASSTFYKTNFSNPILNITGPEGVDIDLTLIPDSGYDITAQGVWDQIEAALEAEDGWTFTLPAGYTQETGTVRIISRDSAGAVENVPFAVTVTSNGSYTDTISSFTFEESTVDADVQGVTISSANDYRGTDLQRASPTTIAIQLLNPNRVGGEEMIFVTAGGTGTYDPATHTGTNGETFTNEETAEIIIDKLRIATSSLNVIDGGVDGEIIITSAGYGAASGIIGDVRVNDTEENAAWILSKYTSANAGSIYLNPYSDVIDEVYFGVASNAPTVAGSLDTQASPDGSRVPSRTTSESTATLSSTTNISNVYDVVRPWRIDEINPNLEYPIIATRMNLEDVANRPVMNKIIAADIGWSIPTFSGTPRVETADFDNSAIIVTENDAPIAYESYVERQQMNMTPDLDTETIHQITLWASGSDIPYIDGEELYNRLQLRYKATDNPGTTVDLSQISDGIGKNILFISEGYKLDTRLHGRYLNLRLTDEILDSDNVVLEATSNSKKTTNTLFSQKSLWEISGLQPEVNKGGRR